MISRSVKYKKRHAFGIFLFCVGIVLLLLIFKAASAASLQEIEQRGYMVVATEDSYPPFEFIQSGAPTGMDHELYELLQKESKFKIQQQILPFQGILAGVATGQYDVALTAANITDERAKSVAFTMPIAPSTSYIVMRKGETRIKTVADLNGLTVGVQTGSAQFQELPYLEELLAKTGGKLGLVIQYPTFPEAYQDLRNGRCDYVVNSAVALASLVSKRGDIFKIGDFPVSRTSYQAWAVKRGNDSLRDYLNVFLGRLRDNGKLYELQKKWLGQSYPKLPRVGLLPGDRPLPD